MLILFWRSRRRKNKEESRQEGKRKDTMAWERVSEVGLIMGTQLFTLLTLILSIAWVDGHLGGLSSDHPLAPFNWHPLLMIFAFVLCETEGTLSAYPALTTNNLHQQFWPMRFCLCRSGTKSCFTPPFT